MGYHCSIEFPCGVPLFYCCKYPTLYTRTHAHLTHGTYGVLDCLLYCAFSKVSPCGVLLFLLKFLVGYYSIVASTPHSMACTRTHITRTPTHVNTLNCGPLIVLPLFGQFFSAMSSSVLFKIKPGTPSQPGTIVPILLKSPV